jgi:hypothetical protein
LVVDSTTPCCGVDGDTTGNTVFTGAAGNTTPLAAEVADPDPPALLAVTFTRSVCPTSEATGVYEDDVAPEMFEHASPLPLQSSH